MRRKCASSAPTCLPCPNTGAPTLVPHQDTFGSAPPFEKRQCGGCQGTRCRGAGWATANGAGGTKGWGGGVGLGTHKNSKTLRYRSAKLVWTGDMWEFRKEVLSLSVHATYKVFMF